MIVRPILENILYITFWKNLFLALGDIICSTKNIKKANMLIIHGIDAIINNLEMKIKSIV